MFISWYNSRICPPFLHIQIYARIKFIECIVYLYLPLTENNVITSTLRLVLRVRRITEYSNVIVFLYFVFRIPLTFATCGGLLVT